MDTPHNEARADNDRDIGVDSTQLDVAARAIGLRKSIAYLPSEKKHKTPQAMAVERSRVRAAARGMKAVNVTIPKEHHDLFKAMAEDLRNGMPIEDVLISRGELEKYVLARQDDVSDSRRSAASLRRWVLGPFLVGFALVRSLMRRALKAAQSVARRKCTS